MQWIYDFIRKYPQVIVTGPVPISCVIEKIKRNYNAEEVSLEHFPAFRIRMQTENAYYYALDEKINLQMEAIQIKVIRIPVTDQIRCYTNKDFVSWNDNTEDIYVVYEEQTGYSYCNSSMLHLEIKMARGISEEDVTHKTEKYREYIALMQRYIENYTDLENQYGLVWSQEMKSL